MIRVALAALAVATLGITAVFAQASPIAERKEAMKAQGRAMYGVLNRMSRGQIPYDKAKAEAAFASIAGTSSKLKMLFPESSKPPATPTDDYSASLKIWENKSDFEARIDALVKAVEENRSKVGSVEEVKVSAAAVNNVCNGCHEVYRVKNK